MSHESFEPGRGVVYTLPELPSDVLRSLRFTQFFEEWHGSPFAVRTADGWSWASSPLHAPALTATFRTRQRLDAVIDEATEARLGRIFLDGDLDIQGDVFLLLAIVEYTLRHSDGLSGNLIRTLGRMTADLSRRLAPWRRDDALRSWHRAPCSLDLPVDFFASWLSPVLSHACAVFSPAVEGFEAAQIRSLDRACAWLQLERGDRLLDVGCGWGSLLLHAAQQYGASTQGIASTETQAEAASDRICRSGLERRCSVESRDLRRAPWRDSLFDKMADIGIFEQTASADLSQYLACARRMLVPGGLFLLHRITRAGGRSLQAGSMHDGMGSETLARELEIAESAGFDITAIESLQEDYEQTLHIWIERLRLAVMHAAAHRAHRAWLLYLVETAAALQTGDMRVHRILLRRPERRSPSSSRPVSGWKLRTRSQN